MKKITLGILAHVDAGKTTLSEALLYLCGCIRKCGRVDHGDTFFDTADIERRRGITVFSKQAIMQTPDTIFYLLDTPGHTDFCAEMERTLDVLDYAIVVVSATDGVQMHTQTVCKLLRRRHIPIFFFVNKTDLAGKSRHAIMAELHALISPAAMDFSLYEADKGLFYEQAAMANEQLMEEYLESGALRSSSLASAIAACELYPCFFGAALKMEGVSTFLSALCEYTKEPTYKEEFAARVFKIGRDAGGNRLTYMKLFGGSLRVKSTVATRASEGETSEEKIDAIRLYSGEKYKTADLVTAGDICAVTGLRTALPGAGLGAMDDAYEKQLSPVLAYRVVLPKDTAAPVAYEKLSQLAEEDPMLFLSWNAEAREITVSLMGEMQMEILREEARARFDLDIDFDMGKIVYRETLTTPIMCAGHFEPLRHYAEVHLLIEGGEIGSGVTFDSLCDENTLSAHWQRLILSQLEARLPVGTLTGSPLTDIRITLTGGKAHIKHTEGGDFRQAATRALRTGLMKARRDGSAVLLEPWYAFTLILPTSCLGRAMTDLERMHAVIKSTEHADDGTHATIYGTAPVACLHAYPAAVQAFTRGQGRISLSFHGYAPCHNTEEVIAALGYDPTRDTRYPADSVFCAGGAGFSVPWEEAEERMHTQSVLSQKKDTEPVGMGTIAEHTVTSRRGVTYTKTHTYEDNVALDKELRAIFERTYGPIPARSIFVPPPRVTYTEREKKQKTPTDAETFLLVDGYNIIYAWEELAALARQSLDLARHTLIHILSNYQGYKRCNLILVFDAWRVEGGKGSLERHGGMFVIYTRERETADAYIERVTYDIGKKYRVRVATSDGAEQVIVFGHGAERVSAKSLHEEVSAAAEEIGTFLYDEKNVHAFLK